MNLVPTSAIYVRQGDVTNVLVYTRGMRFKISKHFRMQKIPLSRIKYVQNVERHERISFHIWVIIRNERILYRNRLHKFNVFHVCYSWNWGFKSVVTLPAKLQKKQCRGAYFWLYGIAFWMPIKQKLPPPVWLFSDFAGWVKTGFLQGFHLVFIQK